MKLTNLQRGLAVGQVQAGRSKAAVAHSFNVTVCTIQNLMVRFHQTGDVKDRSGRPCVNFAQLEQITMQEWQALVFFRVTVDYRVFQKL